MSLGLYLHIPYCFSKCRYCDFYSRPGARGVPPAYPDALLRELARFAPQQPLRPDTIYFGGGTPSLLRPEDAARLIEAASPLPGAEITLEANPETVTEDSLRAFREAGVNRISMGVQSAVPSERKSLGRLSDSQQAKRAVTLFKENGFENISLDLMLGLENQTIDTLDESLDFIKSVGVPHVSAYMLNLSTEKSSIKKQF